MSEEKQWGWACKKCQIAGPAKYFKSSKCPMCGEPLLKIHFPSEEDLKEMEDEGR